VPNEAQDYASITMPNTLPRIALRSIVQRRTAGKVLSILIVTFLLIIGNIDHSPSNHQHRRTSASQPFIPISSYTNKNLDDDETKYIKHPEKIIPIADRKNDDEIRYASFGSSCSWGAGLDNREEEVYVWKLSNKDQERGKNHAIRANGPAFPAACVSSIIGEDEYDVIVLEFWMRSYDSLQLLVKRLRERFPEAIIVMTQLWSPMNVLSDKTHMTVKQWANLHGFPERDFIHNWDFHKAFLDETQGEDHQWYINPRPNVDWELAAEEIGAYTYKMPGDMAHADGLTGMLAMGAKLLANDSYHLSAAGHHDIYESVKNIVDRVGVPKKSDTGKFSATDHCYNWMDSGEIGEGLSYAPNVKLDMMPNTEKYVLEFESDFDGDDGNWIDVYNSNDEEMELSISYMAFGPPPSNYPEVEAIRENGERFLVSTETPPELAKKDLHVSRLKNLGTIGPNSKARVTFKPLETTKWNFRIVQLLIIPRDVLSFASIQLTNIPTQPPLLKKE